MREPEHELRALRSSVEFPATPDIASAVASRLSDTSPASPWPRRVALVAAVLAVAAAAGLAIPQARSAILRVFGVGSVRIHYVDRLPAVRPDAPVALGPTISEHDAPFPLLRSDLVGTPDEVHASAGVVTLLYGTPTDVRLLVTQIASPALGPNTVKKIVGTTTNARIVTVDGSPEPALWIEGDPHVLALPNAPERLAANTLVWLRDGITLRLEGATTLEQALRIASSFH
jgi:hypothetical protein